MGIKSRIKEANIKFEWAENDSDKSHQIEIMNKGTYENPELVICVDGIEFPYMMFKDILDFVHSKWPTIVVS